MKVIAAAIGTKHFCTIPGYPSNDLEGLFDALSRWELDERLDYSNDPQFVGKPGVAPFRSRAWGNCVQQYDAALHQRVWVATRPIHPEHPSAVRYYGNFLEHSFGFWLDTDDPELIAKLDGAIAENLFRSRRSDPAGAPGAVSSKAWRAHDNRGMRYPEEGDLLGGETDC